MYVIMMGVFIVSSLFAFEWGKFMLKHRESELGGAFWYFLFFIFMSIESIVYLVKGSVC